MASFAALSILSYARIQQKQTRYLFDLTLPLAYFAVAGLAGVGARRRRALAAAGLAALSLGGMILAAERHPNALRLDDVRVYERVLGELGPRLADCRLASNAWDFLNYLGRTTEPFPMDNVVGDRIAEGYRLLLFKNMAEPRIERSALDRWPILAETPAYVLIGKPGACLPVRRYVYRYLELRKERDLKLGRRNFPDTLFKLIFR
jgi:hypothetical protein